MASSRWWMVLARSAGKAWPAFSWLPMSVSAAVAVSDLGESAVGHQVHAGAVAALVGGQEENGGSHLLGAADAAQRGHLREHGLGAVGLGLRLELPGEDSRVDGAGAEVVDADAAALWVHGPG